MIKISLSAGGAKNLNGKKVDLFKDKEFTRADMLKIGAKAIQCIQERVRLGRNVNDRPMKRLSKSYADKKQKLGQPAIRNMMFSGSMLGSLVPVRVEKNKVEIGFTPAGRTRQSTTKSRSFRLVRCF